ncbi:MAG: hypothetical protein AAGA67_13600 [Cyanobacteria bacterium P01_F01_bin.153]
MLPVPSSHPKYSDSSATQRPWKRLGFAMLAGGIAMQLGTLPAEAMTLSRVESLVDSIESSEGWAMAIAYNNIASNDRVPRRGDPRPR